MNFKIKLAISSSKRNNLIPLQIYIYIKLYSLRPADQSRETYLWRCEVPYQERDGSGSPAAGDTTESRRKNLGSATPILVSSSVHYVPRIWVRIEGWRWFRRYNRVLQGESTDLTHPSLSLPLSIIYQVSA